MLVSDEEKRWIVVGIAMFQVTAPVLRDFVKQRMDTYHVNLDAYCSGLVTPCTLNTLTYHLVNPDPILQKLKFQNINNNSQMHGTNKSHYNYNICSSLDLAKLYLPDYLAKFAAFDESLDMTAILHLLGFAYYWPAPTGIFSPLIKMLADNVRKNVRNKWGHFDVTEWTEAFFNDCFAKLEALVKSLGLASGMEMTTLSQLKEWQTKGCQLCMGHAVDQHLLSLVQQDLKELIIKYVEMKANISDLKDQQIVTRDQLEKHDKQFEELLKENEEILKRLVRVEKVWSEELEILRSRVEEVESKLSETDVTVVQLGRKSENHEEKLEHLEENSKQQAKKIGQLEQEVRSQWNSDIKRDVTVKQLGRKSEQHEEKLQHLEQEVRSRWNSGIKRIKREHSPMQPFDVESCRRKLAEHYKRSAKVSTSVWSPLCQVELDQIYTRLSWVEKEHTPTGPRELELRHYTDLFTPGKNGLVPKRMLVEGETGIGKSTFVQRLTVDWAELDDAKMTEAQKDVLRKFHLVVSVNLKVVSKCQSFEEVLHCSRLFPLDPVVSTDDLSTYICNNQEKVLLVFDGYDEYRSTSEAEAQFGDRSDSPIFDIFQRNYLRDCAVMVTTRFSRGDELRRCADKQAKITGFDETDQIDFMGKMLGNQIRDLMRFLDERNMSDLAKVPLLNLFFCLMWKQAKQQLTQLVQTETILYQTMIRHILQYSHRRLSPTQVCKVKEEDYEEILAEIGKVALEALLKGSQLFEYGQLSEKVRGEKSIIVGLCQLSECDTSLEPMEMVSFIHKSIQEYLAAWYISNKCVPEGNLGGIEEHTRTFDDCKALENVFKFVCGTTVDGAAKVFKHLGTIRASDPSLDLSKYIPDEENEAFLPLDFLTRNELSFNALIVRLFKEGSSLGSEAEISRNLLDCSGGVIYVGYGMEILPIAKALSQVARSWSLLVDTRFPVSKLYDSLKLLDLLHIPVNITERSKTFKLGEFLTKYQNLNCNQCRFSSVICHRGDRARFYITHLTLCGGDVHVRVFAEVAATIPPEHLSTKLYENQSCMKFLTECFVVDGGVNTESLEDLGTMMRSWKHLKRISIFRCDDSGCDVLEMVPNPELRALSIESECGDACTFTSAGAVKLAGLLPRFNNLTCLDLDLTDCSAEALASLALSITHKTIKTLMLTKIILTPGVAAALGQALGEMTSLEILFLAGEGNCLNVEEMKALFGGFKRTIPLTILCFVRFSARGTLRPLINSLSFFPDLDDLTLVELDMDEHDLRGLLERCRFIPKLRLLDLHGNPLGHAVTSILPHISNLPNFCDLDLTGAACSEEDKNCLREAFGQLPHFGIVHF